MNTLSLTHSTHTYTHAHTHTYARVIYIYGMVYLCIFIILNRKKLNAIKCQGTRNVAAITFIVHRDIKNDFFK